MASSVWVVINPVDLPEGTRYSLFWEDEDREVLVLHSPGSWRGWNGETQCEVTAGMKAAVLDYERA